MVQKDAKIITEFGSKSFNINFSIQRQKYVLKDQFRL